MAMSVADLEDVARRIRIDIIEMTTAAGSGHPGGSLSSADLLAALYFRIMKIDPADPYADGRDRFILSKGHAAPALYSALAERGYFPVEELKTLRRLGSRLQGHPAYRDVPGVEVTTGSLGQGLSMACGIALAAKMDGKDYRTYCLLGDGELQEGQNWEAAMFARKYGLNNLTAFVDRNRLQICGNTEEVMPLDPLPEKFRAFGWNVIIIDGNDMRQIIDACEKAAASKKNPTVVIMKTDKGKGVSFMENNADFHGKTCTPEQYEQAMKELRGEAQ